MMCCMPSIIPENPNPQASKLFRILRILSVLQMGFGIFNMFVDLSDGFYMLLGALLLYMIPCGRNWCTSVIYIILCMISMVSVAFLLMSYFKSHTRIESEYGVFLAITMLKLPFFTITIYYSFLTYRCKMSIYTIFVIN